MLGQVIIDLTPITAGCSSPDEAGGAGFGFASRESGSARIGR
ncbi:hypothetical protein [Streptomyces sp. ODS05-4]|nr:hypothetical protein [Streptomyces sp. ODS05-4]